MHNYFSQESHWLYAWEIRGKQRMQYYAKNKAKYSHVSDGNILYLQILFFFFCKHSYSNNITGGGKTANRQHDHDNVVRSFLSCFRTENVPWMMSSDLLTFNHFRTFAIHVCLICCLAKKCPTQRTLGPLNNNNNKRTITKAK